MSRKTGTLLSLVLAVLLVAGTAEAQATPPSPSARQLELAHRYVQAVHMDKMMDGVMKTMIPTMLEHMPKNPNITDAQRQVILEVTADVTSRMMGKVMTQMEPIMAETFSEKELGELVAFYEGPTGQAVIARTPQMTTRLMAVVFAQMPEMQAEMRARICARIECKATDKSLSPKPS